MSHIRKIARLINEDPDIIEESQYDTCPGCKSNQAYLTFYNEWECPTKQCKNFSQRRYNEVNQQLTKPGPFEIWEYDDTGTWMSTDILDIADRLPVDDQEYSDEASEVAAYLKYNKITTDKDYGNINDLYVMGSPSYDPSGCMQVVLVGRNSNKLKQFREAWTNLAQTGQPQTQEEMIRIAKDIIDFRY